MGILRWWFVDYKIIIIDNISTWPTVRCFLSSIILVRYLTTLSDTQKTHRLPQYWDSHKPASLSGAPLNSRHPNPSNTCTSTEVIRGILRTFQRPCAFFLSVFLRRHSAQIFRQEAAHSAGSRVPQRQVWPWNSQLQMNKHTVWMLSGQPTSLSPCPQGARPLHSTHSVYWDFGYIYSSMSTVHQSSSHNDNLFTNPIRKLRYFIATG